MYLTMKDEWKLRACILKIFDPFDYWHDRMEPLVWDGHAKSIQIALQTHPANSAAEPDSFAFYHDLDTRPVADSRAAG